MTPAGEAAYWDWVASDFDRIQAEVYSDLDLDECMATISDGLNIRVGEDILELGCGPGRLLHNFANLYPMTSWVGLDSSAIMVELAASYDYTNMLIVQGNGRQIIGVGPFDGVYSMTMFQHIPPEAQQGYMLEVGRVLRHGGRFRLQFVYDAIPAPMSQPVTVKEMLRWAGQAGLVDVKVDMDRMRVGWCWLTLVKP